MNQYSQFANSKYTAAQREALRLLAELPKRDIYEGATPAGQGCGKYWVTYGDGEEGPVLSTAEVEQLLRDGVIVAKWPNAPPGVHCYRLAPQGPEQHD